MAFLIGVILSIESLNLFIGKYFEHDCQIQPRLPTWIMVNSFVIIVLVIDLLILKYFQFKRNIFIAWLLSLFLLTWLIKGECLKSLSIKLNQSNKNIFLLGSIWTLSIYNIVSFESTSDFYCSRVCYLFVTLNIITLWLFVVALIAYLIIVSFLKRNITNT